MKGFSVITIFMLLQGTVLAAEDVIPTTPEQERALGITVAPLRATKDIIGTKFPAEVVVPNVQLRVVSALQPGLIEVLLVAEGDVVAAGQPLARINSPELLQLQRDLLQSLTQLRFAKTTLDRDRQLAEEGIIPRRRFLETRRGYEVLVTSVEQSRQALLLVGMDGNELRQLESAQKMSSTLIVRSPLDGVVLEQMTVAGERVDAASPLYRVAKLKPLWLEVHVPMAQAENVTIGDRIILPDEQLDGRIIAVGRAVHGADQGVLVRAEVDKGAERLRPAQFVQAQIVQPPGANGFFQVARTALVRSRNKALIFAKTEQGFRAHEVRVVSERGEDVVITADLADGTPIAVNGTAVLKAALTGLGGEG